ncbi:hypothetical protein Q5P01_004991 [Channa striata]|uniref:Uncharacterized protein n=1 Tax=Channa striata TaxID=64152 RepID=A0AA88T2M5_CHASR|nr:hypothetical protein Q5P01_004991 [Channa striata]
MLGKDTPHSAKRVMDDLKFNYLLNKKFVEFHHDITEECGAEDKQHSRDVTEKQEEIIMHGPYYPNYNTGEHSEDLIIKQTQELLESETLSEDCKVPRNGGVCME